MSIKRALGIFSLVLGTILPARSQTIAEIVIMRHGIRPPILTSISTPPLTNRPWPTWPSAAGQLTQNGASMIEALGHYTRARWEAEAIPSSAGSLNQNCPEFRSDNDQRTIDTAKAFAIGASPSCPNAISTGTQASNSDAIDPLFDPVRAGKVVYDNDAAFSQMEASLSRWNQSDAKQGLAKSTQLLGKILENNDWFSHPNQVVKRKSGKPSLRGSLLAAFQISDTFMMEFEQGLTSAWGEANEREINQLLAWNATYAQLTQRVPYIAQRESAGFLKLILDRFNEAAPPSSAGHLIAPLVIVGHDDNISAIAGALGLVWGGSDLPENVAMPGGGLVFSLDRGNAGQLSVRIRYIAPTIAQVRAKTRFDLQHPPVSLSLASMACSGSKTCSLSEFSKNIHNLIDPLTVTSTPSDTKTGQ